MSKTICQKLPIAKLFKLHEVTEKILQTLGIEMLLNTLITNPPTSVVIQLCCKMKDKFIKVFFAF